MEQVDLIINKLPAPTWNRLKMNFAKAEGISLPQDICEPVVALQGSICLNKSNAAGCCGCSGKYAGQRADFSRMATGMGEDMDKLGAGQTLHLVADSGKSTAVITWRHAENTGCYNRVEIEAHDDSEVTVIMTYISTAAAAGMAAVQTKIAAGNNAKVKLVQVQLLGSGFVQLNDVGSELQEKASLEVLQLQLGAARIYNGVRTELMGDNSNFDAAIGYYGRHWQHLDMNFIANHHGKNTTCNMDADGVLQSGAFKLYRGTIDFKLGCSGAVGAENETVLLLSDDVVNQSIPLILCGEEDVQGNHGASIGKMDEDLLFYLCSRGFSEQEAVDMMAKAKIDALCRRIGDEVTMQLVQRYLEGVMADAE